MDAIKKGRAEGLNKVSNALFEKATQVMSRLWSTTQEKAESNEWILVIYWESNKGS